ncbi:MAG: hypothetical protein ACK4PR_12980, partial [Gammaproteobacteria bacterium]
MSKQEYKDTYVNIHGGIPVQVTATIVLENGEKHTISRIMRSGINGETSDTLVDGVLAEFETIGISPLECFYPVIAQHELQSFIHTQPKNRRDEISAALGLEEMTVLKTTLQGLNQSLISNPPTFITESKKKLVFNIN